MARKNMRVLPSGKYQAMETIHFDDGSTKRVYGTGLTPDKAKTALKHKIEKEMDKFRFGQTIEDGEVSLGDTVHHYLENQETYDVTGHKKRDTTLDVDILAYEKFIKPLPIAKKKMKDVHVADCMDWQQQVNKIKSHSGKTPSASYKNRAFTLMKKVIDRYTARMEIRSPMDAIERWKNPVKSRNELDSSILSTDDLQKLVDYCLERIDDDDDKPAALLFILFCYCRSGEALALQKRDYGHKEHEHEIFVNRTIIHHNKISEDGRTKSRDSIRYLHLPPVAIMIVEKKIRKCKNDTDLIFTTANGNIIDTSNLNTYFKRLLKRLRIASEGLHVHNLRTIGITYTQALDGDSHGVERRAGHSSVSTTEKYYTGATKQQVSSADRAADIFANQLTKKAPPN